jgi:arylformamidase
MAPPTLLSGLYDLEPVMLSHVNEWPHLGRESTHRNSQIHRLPAGPVPLTFSFGPGETAEFKR